MLLDGVQTRHLNGKRSVQRCLTMKKDSSLGHLKAELEFIISTGV